MNTVYPYAFKDDFIKDNDVSAYVGFIIQLVSLTGCRTYLELGVAKGYTFSQIVPLVQKAIGIDLVDKRDNVQNEEFYAMSTDDFFAQFSDIVTADIIFIDADHSFPNIKKDFDNSLKILNKHGIIIIDDTDPIDKGYASDEHCVDAYKIVPYILNTYPHLNIVTLPIMHKGMSLIMRKNDIRVSDFL